MAHGVPVLLRRLERVAAAEWPRQVWLLLLVSAEQQYTVSELPR